MTAETIMKMIEAVDPSDAAMMDEINAHVWLYLNPDELKWYGTAEKYIEGARKTFNGHSDGLAIRHLRYTRCRDALKSIRPNGWSFVCHPLWCSAHGGKVTYSEPEVNFYEYETLQSPVPSKTEELAELHAIIQAIEYERKNK